MRLKWLAHASEDERKTTRRNDVNPMNAEANLRSVRITCEVGAPIERLRTCAPKR
ncbi:MAG: hypothetical protein ACTS4T_01260 [Candidatus Hodgkinia cicadicola]